MLLSDLFLKHQMLWKEMDSLIMASVLPLAFVAAAKLFVDGELSLEAKINYIVTKQSYLNSSFICNW